MKTKLQGLVCFIDAYCLISQNNDIITISRQITTSRRIKSAIINVQNEYFHHLRKVFHGRRHLQYTPSPAPG